MCLELFWNTTMTEVSMGSNGNLCTSSSCHIYNRYGLYLWTFFYSTVQKSTTMMKVPLYAWLLHIWSHLSQIFCFQTKTDSYKHHDNYKKTHSLEFQDISLRSIDVTLCNCHYSKDRTMWWEWLVCLQHVTQCYFKMGLVQGGIVKGMMGSGLWMAEAEWQL